MIKKGFTLAEVLITLAVVGIVATITIPPVVKNIQDYAFAKAKENSLLKIREATGQMKSNDVLSDYTSNNDFIDVFQKYMSVVQRCDSSHLSDCFVSKFRTADNEEIETSSLISGTDLGGDNLADGTIGLMLKNGTTMLFTLKDSEKAESDCLRIDPTNNTSNTTSCMSFLYDINGRSGPNVMGKDIGSVSVTGLGCSGLKIDGTCYHAALAMPPPLSPAQCSEQQAALGITACYNPAWNWGEEYESDYWAGAVAACGGVSKVATTAQLDKLAEAIYDGGVWEDESFVWDATLNAGKAGSVGIPSEGADVWAEEVHVSAANIRFFASTMSGRNQSQRHMTGLYVICVP